MTETIPDPAPPEPNTTHASASATRRALVRSYKESRLPAGVFVIRNRVNGRVYVGGSLNLDGAMNRHRFELRMRSHRNKLLMRDWLEHGADNFAFEVVDRLKEHDDPHFDYAAELQSVLALWHEEFDSQQGRGYNLPARPAGASK